GKFFTMINERFPSFRLGLVPIAPARPRSRMAPRHLSAREAVRVAEELHIETSVAVHFGTFEFGFDGQHEPVDSFNRALAERASPPRFWALRNGEVRVIPAAPPPVDTVGRVRLISAPVGAQTTAVLVSRTQRSHNGRHRPSLPSARTLLRPG